ncbi:MAG: hypothetical protein ACJ0GH_00220 [Alphaproteobacteria bacterium]
MFEIVNSNDPYDNNLDGKRLICISNSDSIEDWGVRFLSDRKVVLFSLDKFLYEIYKYQRTYRTDLRNINIFKGNDIEFVISRQSLRFGNKQCTKTSTDPRIILEKRIIDIKNKKTKFNKI